MPINKGAGPFINGRLAMFNEINYVPEGFLQASARDLLGLLGKPTLIHLPGRREEPLFVSVLLHGNETTGLEAVQRLLRDYQEQMLPRALSIFIGNVSAAAAGLRRLDGQPDFNRIWPGTELPACGETDMANMVVETMAQRHVFASVDVHNNTGLNPHYACVNSLDPQFLHLATLFGRLVVFFLRPVGVQSSAFARLCPAVTLECGKPGQSQGLDHAVEYLSACLNIAEIPMHAVAAGDIDLYHTVAQVTIPESISFGYRNSDADLDLNPDLDHFNFTEIEAGTVWGRIHTQRVEIPVLARDERGEVVTADYFARTPAQELISTRRIMPSMLTLDEKVVAQDCLCYLMERVDI